MPGFSYSDITGIVTPAGTISLNAASGDTFFVDPTRSDGLGDSRLRTTIIDRGQTDGYTLLPSFEEGQHIALGGVALIRSAALEAAYVAARDAMLIDARTKLKSILGANGTLTFASSSSLTVRCEMLIKASGAFEKDFLLGLVSATPA